MIKVLITDDHPVVRQGLKQILKDTADISVTGEANNGQEALDQVLVNNFDVVLLDISMPGRSGLETLKELKHARPDLKVLILSMFPEQQYAIRALKASAAGYLTKASAPEELITAIRSVAHGRKYLSATLAEIIALDLSGEAAKLPHEALSNREYHVMCMLAAGKTVSTIGKELALSAKTISTYRRRILDKLLMKSNAEITHYVIQQGLIS